MAALPRPVPEGFAFPRHPVQENGEAEPRRSISSDRAGKAALLPRRGRAASPAHV